MSSSKFIISDTGHSTHRATEDESTANFDSGPSPGMGITRSSGDDDNEAAKTADIK
ncbi:hypothetical protein HK405_000984, partial [Cladochytrium tenue]